MTTTDESRHKAMARAIKRKATTAGMVVLIRDDEGRAHLIAGHDIEVIAIYSDKVKTGWIVEDLAAARIDR